MDVPAPLAGTVGQLRVTIGDRVSEGSVLLTLECDGAGPVHRTAARTRPRSPAAGPTRRTEPPALGGRSATPRWWCSAPARAATRRPSGPPTSGLRTVLVERYERLGGVCLNVGCIPSKALLHAARVIAEAEEMAAHGISFGEPQIDLDALIGVEGVGRGQAHRRARRAGQAAQGRGRPRRRRGSPGRTRSPSATARSRFENCIIAAGSQAATIPGLPDDPRIIDSTGALSPSGRSPSACWSSAAGSSAWRWPPSTTRSAPKVTVVEMLDQLIPGCDPDLVRPLQKRDRAALRGDPPRDQASTASRRRRTA